MFTIIGNTVAAAIVIFLAVIVVRSLRREPRRPKSTGSAGSGGSVGGKDHSETRIK